jgi:ribonuclease Z
VEKIKINFLGTGDAVPTKKRNHTAILLSYKSENILIDCGEGTQKQFRTAKISPNKITRLLVTHWHGDHILGIPGLFQTLKMNEYKKTLYIYGPKGITKQISLLKQLFKIKIETKEKEVFGKFLEHNEFYLEAKQMDHGLPSLAYSFVIKNQIRLDKKKLKKLKLPNSPLLGKLKQGKDIAFEGKKIKAKDVSIIEKGKKITFIFDTLPNSNAISLAKNSDLLICEASFSKEEKEKAHKYLHLTATDAATIAKKAKVKKLILTHISQRYEKNPDKLKEEAKIIFKDVSLVKDFDIIEI